MLLPNPWLRCSICGLDRDQDQCEKLAAMATPNLVGYLEKIAEKWEETQSERPHLGSQRLRGGGQQTYLGESDEQTKNVDVDRC